jgi:hypothetical protein
MRALLLRLSSLLFLAAGLIHAEPPVPSPLEPWRAWVLRGEAFRACPLIAQGHAKAPEDFLCAWPGVLKLDADDRGANVAQHWRVEAESWVPLPGDATHWPQQVVVDGQPSPVVDHGGPALRLAAGSHDVRARIPWSGRPETLHVPASVGLVALSIDGKIIVPVQRGADDITLGRAESATPEADSVAVRVYRKLADGVPALLTTVIQLDVSGQAREIVVGPALPDGFAPLALVAESWPARLDADGRLHVQVQPGSETVNLDARATAPLAKVVARVPEAPWPQQEIWSYEAAPAQRVTSAESALRIDPRQSEVPDEWNTLPAFALGDGATLTVEQRSRGLASDEKNRLTLDREMWLDFSGDGWFARDRLGGEMLRGWRFDVAAPLTLERADALDATARSEQGESLLVTRGTTDGSSGVEWRTPAVDLSAGVRIASAASVLPVTGWQDSFDRVRATLHLPSGYKLIGAPGADSAYGSWFSQWSLLDVFIAAIVALLAWRLFGIAGAAIAIGYLVLGYQESGAPLWTLLAAIALALIARALPAGRLANVATWLQRAALVALVLFALPFVAAELRYALHPQLENEDVPIVSASDDTGLPKPQMDGLFRHRAARLAEPTESVDAPAAAPPPPEPPSAESGGRYTRDQAEKKLETVMITGSKPRRADVMESYSESTVMQTGAGEPSWSVGARYVLGWSGPVLPSQTVRLVIAPPWIVRALRVVLVALLALLIVRLVRGEWPAWPRARAVAGAIAALAFALTAPSPANAQAFPPEDLLAALRTQLVEPPACVPDCANLARAEVEARGDDIRVALEAHAAARVAFPLPDGAGALTLRGVTVDGAAQEGLARDKGALNVALARGVHRIELSYVATADKVALRFPVAPMRVAFAGDGWQASGIGDDRLLTETLSLARARDAGASGPATGAQQFAPFVRVEREISLGLNWTLSTTVHRLAPKDGGFTVSVPALAGEHVSTAGVRTERGQVLAALADGEDATTWESTLDKSDTLTLTAPALTDRAEAWGVTVSPLWHLGASGVPVSADTTTDKNDYHRFAFDPLPGETLALRVAKPAAADGATRAIDHASLVRNAAARASDTTLTLSVRASQGGEHVVTLPADAEVVNVARDGDVLNLRPSDGKLSLPVVPGRQTFEIRFREPQGAALATATPAVALGMPAANIDIGVELPADRWLLATSGPAEGPAVLYWSELAVMLLVAWALARTRRTPLRLWQWILLGIGFSTFSWLALAVAVAWLFALDWRARGPSPSSAVLFDVSQIALAVLTLVALVCLAAAIPQGLLGAPDMHVAGHGSYAQTLRWFADRSSDALPQATAISVPLWVYKVAMLAWALWLANAVVGWLRHGFAAWTKDGYWRALRRKPVVDVPAATAPPA